MRREIIIMIIKDNKGKYLYIGNRERRKGGLGEEIKKGGRKGV